MKARVGSLLLGVLIGSLHPLAQAPRNEQASLLPRGACAGSGSVRWVSLAPRRDRDVLDRWCDSVGPPFVAPGSTPAGPVKTLVIATWNVHVGNGDVAAFLASLARVHEVRAPHGVVLLLQEVVRTGAEVPERYPERMRPPGGIRARRAAQDVGALAQRLGLHAAYVPSMRNGHVFTSDAREDRGNAILSTWPLEDVRALELPFGQQRHVAVAARIRVTGLPPLRTISVHLDPSGHRADEAAALAAHLRERTGSDEALVIGGDLNTWFGRREQALHVLSNAVAEERCGREKTNSWPWRLEGPLGWWRGRLDYLFSTLPALVARSCETLPDQFGSDHRPVVMTIDIPDR